MISAKFLAFAVVAIMVSISAAHFEGHGKDWKCKPNRGAMEEKMAVFKECYEGVTGKTFNMTVLYQEGGPLKEEKPVIQLCVAKKLGVINDDDTLNVEAAKDELKMIDTDDTTKANIEESINECNSEGGTPEVILDCLQDAFKSNCKGPSSE